MTKSSDLRSAFFGGYDQDRMTKSAKTFSFNELHYSSFGGCIANLTKNKGGCPME